MGSKYKEVLLAGLATLMIPLAKLIIESILERMSNKKYIGSKSEGKDRESYSSRYTAKLNDISS